MSQDRVILVQEEPRIASQTIELLVTKNGETKIKWPDESQLRNSIDQTVVIKSIRLVAEGVLVAGPLSGLVMAPVAELQKMVLTIYCEGWEKAQLMPILILNDMEVPGSTLPHRYNATKFSNWENVDWNKSFISFVNGFSSAISGAGYCVCLDVEYIRLDEKGREIIGPSS